MALRPSVATVDGLLRHSRFDHLPPPGRHVNSWPLATCALRQLAVCLSTRRAMFGHPIWLAARGRTGILIAALFHPEIGQIFHVSFITGSLLVLGHLQVVRVFRRGGFPLKPFSIMRRQRLPVLTDDLCHLGERQVLAPEVFAGL